jgi:hypothetical protein
MIILSIRPCGTSRVLSHAVKSYDIGPPALLPVREEGVLRIFIALTGFERANFGSSGKHSNHYTTKATGMNGSRSFQGEKRQPRCEWGRGILGACV